MFWRTMLLGFEPQRWRQHSPPKCWYPTITLHDATTQKTMNSIFFVMKTSNLASVKVSFLSFNSRRNIFQFITVKPLSPQTSSGNSSLALGKVYKVVNLQATILHTGLTFPWFVS